MNFYGGGGASGSSTGGASLATIQDIIDLEGSEIIWRGDDARGVPPSASEFKDPNLADIGMVVLSSGTREIWERDGTSWVLRQTLTSSEKKIFRPASITDGQTAFTLPSAPIDPTTLEMKVNGVVHSPIESPSVLTTAGTSVIWTNNLHEIEADDQVWFTYT